MLTYWYIFIVNNMDVLDQCPKFLYDSSFKHVCVFGINQNMCIDLLREYLLKV